MKYAAAGYYRSAVPDFLLLNDDCVKIFRGLLDSDYKISTDMLSGSDYIGKLAAPQECSYRLSEN
jgi:hypothetical protein